MSRLAEMRADATERLILEAAIGLLQEARVGDLTVRGVARASGISERTIFRYFADREAFLDAIAAEFARRVGLPPDPATVEEILAAPRALYTRFEAMAPLVRAALDTEISQRMRRKGAHSRWVAVGKVIERAFPRTPERDRKLAAANIRYYLSASTWHYYRDHFGLGVEDTIACGELAIRQALEGLKRRG
jgi:AcrR family transcriptional regulator